MSVVVDTSIWIDYLRRGDDHLAELLDRAQVLMHPWILGELTLGGASRNPQVSALLNALSTAPLVSETELMTFIDARSLHGHGIGYVDAQLLAATSLAQGATLWSRDKSLRTVARNFGIAHET